MNSRQERAALDAGRNAGRAGAPRHPPYPQPSPLAEAWVDGWIDGDIEAGMEWWEGLAADQRASWLKRAGSTTPAKAWAAYKRDREKVS